MLLFSIPEAGFSDGVSPLNGLFGLMLPKQKAQAVTGALTHMQMSAQRVHDVTPV